MKNNSYRILKLKSGEELITKITSSKSNKLIIEKPMIFKSTTVTDAYGRAKEITVLKDWLLYADHKETSIPKDFVASFLKPDLDVLELYQLEKKKDEEQKKKNRIIKRPNKDTINKKNIDAENEFDSIMNILNKYKNKDDIVDKIMNNIENMSDEEFQEMQDEQEPQESDFENYITMNIVLPPEALLSLVDSGLIEEEEIMRMIHALKSQAEFQSKMNNNIMDYYNSKNKTYKNDGKDWKDWSPFPEDYLDDEDLD